MARLLATRWADLTLAAALETTPLLRVAGPIGDRTAWVTMRPCRPSHQTIADVGMIGSGPVPLPGQVCPVLVCRPGMAATSMRVSGYRRPRVSYTGTFVLWEPG